MKIIRSERLTSDCLSLQRFVFQRRKHLKALIRSEFYESEATTHGKIKAKKSTISKAKAKQEELKKYIFIIDEINRGEISKIFGELFFAIDPGYRGKAGEISTQYSNLHSDPGEKLYIPEIVLFFALIAL